MTLRRLAVLTALLAAGLLQFLLFRSARLHELALEAGLPADRVRLLRSAERAFPWNDRVSFELGQALAETASEDLAHSERRDAALLESQRSFLRGLRLNPGFTQGHLGLAEVLRQMSYLGLPAAGSSFEAYKRAALLTGHNTRVYLDVALILLGRWTALSPGEKEFAADILGKALGSGGPERLGAILPVWELGGRDYPLMASVLPDDSRMLRAYATYLGERSLSLEARWAILARAENLEFLRARDDFNLGSRLLDYYRIPEARERLTDCRRSLEGIRFYQDLAGGPAAIPADEHARLLADTYLRLARCTIEETGSLATAMPDLEAYLDHETGLQGLGELERSLRERGLLPARAGEDLEDLGRLAFDLDLGFRQNRYRETAEFGRRLESRFLAVPRDRTREFARVLKIVGDAFQKLDFLYESEAFHLRAREADPDGLEALLSLRKTYLRIDDKAKAGEVEAAIRGLLTPAETVFDSGIRLEKGAPWTFPLVSDGGPLEIRAVFEIPPGARAPIVTAVFNGRVVGEAVPEGAAAVLKVDARPGSNELVLTAVDAPAALHKIGLAPRAEVPSTASDAPGRGS